MQGHGYLYQTLRDTWQEQTNGDMTQWAREPIAWRHEGKGSKTQTRTMTNFKIKDMKNKNMKQNPKQTLQIRISLVSSQDLEKRVHAFITSRVDYCNGLLTAFQRRPLDSCSSSRTLLPGFWLEPENLSISHQSSLGPYTGFQLH